MYRKSFRITKILLELINPFSRLQGAKLIHKYQLYSKHSNNPKVKLSVTIPFKIALRRLKSDKFNEAQSL